MQPEIFVFVLSIQSFKICENRRITFLKQDIWQDFSKFFSFQIRSIIILNSNITKESFYFGDFGDGGRIQIKASGQVWATLTHIVLLIPRVDKCLPPYFALQTSFELWSYILKSCSWKLFLGTGLWTLACQECLST